MIWETVRLALISVRRNVLRSFLTLLGIVIGVAAVIAMITIGSGTTEKVKSDISKLGSNLLVVRAARARPVGLDLVYRPRSWTTRTMPACAWDWKTRAPSRLPRKAARASCSARRTPRSRSPEPIPTSSSRATGTSRRPHLHRIRNPQRHQCLRRRADGQKPVLRCRRPGRPVGARRQDELPHHRRARREGHVRLRPGPGQCRHHAADHLSAPHRGRPRHRHDLRLGHRRRGDVHRPGRDRAHPARDAPHRAGTADAISPSTT
jgi:hypothetical protein